MVYIGDAGHHTDDDTKALVMDDMMEVESTGMVMDLDDGLAMSITHTQNLDPGK